MDTFVEMRNFLRANEELFARLDRLENKQLEMGKQLEDEDLIKLMLKKLN